MEAQTNAERSAPKLRQVHPGIYLVHLPLPMRPRVINVYLLDGGDEWALIDTGMNTPESLAALRAACERAGTRLERLSKIICTHHHPDHYGASKALKEISGATLYLHRDEYERSKTFAPADRPLWVTEYFEAIGIPMRRFAHVPSPHEFWSTMYVPTAPDVFLSEGDVLRVGKREIEVVWTPGHAPGHCVFYLRNERILVVGDHLLPKITPHVGYFPRSATNPLGDFLDSQRKVQRVDVELVLPAHGGTFVDHRRRAEQIIAHHRARLRKVFEIIRAKPRRPYEVARDTFGFDPDAPVFVQFPATFETLAHLEYLCHAGKAVREEETKSIVYRAA